VAFARTALIRSREPHPRDREAANKIRLGYYEHIAAQPLPSLSVIQDIDAPDTGFGAFWGEVQTHVHAGLGCAGVITDGFWPGCRISSRPATRSFRKRSFQREIVGAVVSRRS